MRFNLLDPGLSFEYLHNEQSLVEAMQTGSEEAFTALYRKYSPPLYLNIKRIIHDPILTEEIVQEVFARVWEKRKNKGLQENFAGYIYRISQHLVHDFFRKLQRDRRLLERFRSAIEADYEQVEELLHKKESTILLKKAIEQLPPQQKKVYELVRIEGCSYKKAAEIMGISPLTIKEYLVTTKKSIRSYLLNNMDMIILLLLSSLVA